MGLARCLLANRLLTPLRGRLASDSMTEVDESSPRSRSIVDFKDPALRMPFQGVLGTEGFLDKFAVTFDKYYDYFVVERPGNYHERMGKNLDDDLMTAYDPQWAPQA